MQYSFCIASFAKGNPLTAKLDNTRERVLCTLDKGETTLMDSNHTAHTHTHTHTYTNLSDDKETWYSRVGNPTIINSWKDETPVWDCFYNLSHQC